MATVSHVDTAQLAFVSPLTASRALMREKLIGARVDSVSERSKFAPTTNNSCTGTAVAQIVMSNAAHCNHRRLSLISLLTACTSLFLSHPTTSAADGLAQYPTGNCLRDPGCSCSCTFQSDKTKRIDLSSLASSNPARPAFVNLSNSKAPTDPTVYSYNPCKRLQCGQEKNVDGCQMNYKSPV